MTFYGFGPNPIVLDPSPAVTNMINSPMYQNAQFVSGFGQFGEMMQPATFSNKMDPERGIDVEVTPVTGGLFQIGSAEFGNVLIDFLDAQALTIIQLTGVCRTALSRVA